MKLVILVVLATVAYGAVLSDSDKRAVGVCLATQVSDNSDKVAGAGAMFAQKAGMDLSIKNMKAKLNTQLQALKAKYAKAKTDAVNAMGSLANVKDVPNPKDFGGGSYYVRWGRWNCPTGQGYASKKGDVMPVYTGWVGGGYYQHKGSGAEYLCMADVPDYGQYNNGSQDAALLYTTEYQYSGYGVNENGSGGEQGRSWNLKSNQDRNMPCVVCETMNRSSVFMFPGRKNCPGSGGMGKNTGSAGAVSGAGKWTTEYWGYISAAHHGHNHPTTWICIDRQSQPNRVTNNGNQDGSLLYPTEIECHTGGHPGCGAISGTRMGFPPSQTGRYVNNRELVCCICSK